MKYVSHSTLAFDISVKGSRRHISFNPETTGGSSYSTTDDELIETLEASDLYGELFSKVQEKEPEAVTADLEDVEEVSSFSDAKIFLGEKGVTETIKSKEQAKELGASLGYNFPNLN